MNASGFALYRVIADFVPSAEYVASGCLTITCGDMLEVKRPVQLEDGTEQQPKGKFFDTGLYVTHEELSSRPNLKVRNSSIQLMTLLLSL